MVDNTAENLTKKLRHDWYQTDSHVIITIFIKNTSQENVFINFEERQVNVHIKLQSNSEVLNFDLWHLIQPNNCSYKIYSTKIEIKLLKQEGLKWDLLEGKGPDKDVKVVSVPLSSEGAPSRYPSSSTKKCDWDKLEAQVKKEEESEGPEGDAALNQLFQKIYANGNEEVKKAMNKSFMESGGTVLSTNWNEVGEKQVDVKAPDGMEWKNWEK